MTDSALARVALAEVERRSARDFGSEQPEVRNNNVVIRCPCPDHADQNPSCFVDKNTLAWHCFGCGRGGGLYAIGGGGYKPLVELLGLDPAAYETDEGRHAALDQTLAASRQRQDDALRHALTVWWREHRFQEQLLSDASIMAWLDREGIDEAGAKRFGLGLSAFPVKADDEWMEWPALQIPWTVRGEVRAVQLRLIGSEPPGGRYRWQKVGDAGGQPTTLFNADVVLDGQPDDSLLVVEGAKKAMALSCAGYQACGLVNKSGWHERFAPPFGRFPHVVFVPDPDGAPEFIAASRNVPHSVVARLPMKPDDLLLRFGPDTFDAYLGDARRWG